MNDEPKSMFDDNSDEASSPSSQPVGMISSEAKAAAKTAATDAAAQIKAQARRLMATRIDWPKVGKVGALIAAPTVLVLIVLIAARFIGGEPGDASLPTIEPVEPQALNVESNAPDVSNLVQSLPVVAEPLPPLAPTAVNESLADTATPPVPPTSSAALCSLGLTTLNRIHGLTRSPSPSEQEWTRFGYECVSKGWLTATAKGFAPLNNTSPSRPSVASVPARPPTTTPRNPKAVPARHTAPTVVAAPAAPMPPTPKLCALRGSVSKSDGSPLANATVMVEGLGGSVLSRRLETDASGTFTVSDLPPALRVRVLVRARGFQDGVVVGTSCAPLPPIKLKKSNLLSVVRDATRRADRKLKRRSDDE